MGVEPTVARSGDPPTVLKTAEPTGTQPSPPAAYAMMASPVKACRQRALTRKPPNCLTTIRQASRITQRAEVAQLVEQRTENAWVPSSSLGLGTSAGWQRAGVVQR